MAWRLVTTLLLCALLYSTASATGDKPEWKYCHKEKTPVQLAKFNFSPEAPSPGDLVAFNITGKTGKQIPEGTVGISVELGKIPIYSTSGNLCVSTHCPVPKGPFSVAFEQLLPRLTPPGRYTVKMIFSDKANSLAGPPLLCIEVAFTVKSAKRS